MASMIAALGAIPCYAADSNPESSSVTVYQLENGITVERTILESDISTYATKQNGELQNRLIELVPTLLLLFR